MTGNQDQNRIAVVRHTHNSCCLGISNCCYDLLIASCFTVWNVTEGIPYALLKFVSQYRERKIKRFSVPGKVFRNLSFGIRQIETDMIRLSRFCYTIRKLQRSDAVLIFLDSYHAQRCLTKTVRAFCYLLSDIFRRRYSRLLLKKRRERSCTFHTYRKGHVCNPASSFQQILRMIESHLCGVLLRGQTVFPLKNLRQMPPCDSERVQLLLKLRSFGQTVVDDLFCLNCRLRYGIVDEQFRAAPLTWTEVHFSESFIQDHLPCTSV